MSLSASDASPPLTLKELQLTQKKSAERVQKSLNRQLSYSKTDYMNERANGGWIEKVGTRDKAQNLATYAMRVEEDGSATYNCNFYAGEVGNGRLFCLVSATDHHLADDCIEKIPVVVKALFKETGSEEDADIYHALKYTPHVLNEMIKRDQGVTSEWAAISFAYINEKDLWVAGCGNVRVMVYDKTEAVPLTYDAVIGENCTDFSFGKRGTSHPENCSLNYGIGGGNKTPLISRAKITRIHLKELTSDSTLLMVSEGFTKSASARELYNTAKKRSLSSICSTLICSARASHWKKDLGVFASRIDGTYSLSQGSQSAPSQSLDPSTSFPLHQPSPVWQGSWLDLDE